MTSGVHTRTVLYLHGFASSPQSTKAAYFASRLKPHRIDFRCPDFNQPDFATLTMSRMLEQIGGELSRLDSSARPERRRRAALVGSSLGGTLAILAAARFPARVDRLVLLAPAVMFAKPGHHLLPPERVAEWRTRGALPFFHYGDHTERELAYTFYADSLQYDAFTAPFDQPTLIFQGSDDTSVDPRTVEAFARGRPNVTLTVLEDDHQLIASLPVIWTAVAPLLGVPA